MISFSFAIKNPYPKDSDAKCVHYIAYDKKITAHKAVEFQVSSHMGSDFLEFNIDLSWSGEDHAGPRIMLCVVGFYMSASLYDTRHWNYQKGRWNTDADREEY